MLLVLVRVAAVPLLLLQQKRPAAPLRAPQRALMCHPHLLLPALLVPSAGLLIEPVGCCRDGGGNLAAPGCLGGLGWLGMPEVPPALSP